MARPALTLRPRVRRGPVWRKRRGLAPLEFVLWAPVLLFMMALMVNYGTAAAWRLRGEVVARDAVWRTRWPRSSGDEAPPAAPVWPAPATQTSGGAPPFTPLDLPALTHPVARGPLPNGFEVRPVLDPTLGAVAGSASIERRYPLLPRIGSFSSGSIDHPLLDRTWTCAQQGVPNSFRRTLVLYRLPKTDPSLPAAYAAAVQQMFAIPHWNSLSVLDRDAEWTKYEPWHGMGRPDFHPRINAGRCETDRNTVRDQEVNRLVDVRQADGRWRLGEISLLPRTLTRAFLSMYQATEAAMNAELNAMPPPPPARVTFLEAELAHIEQQIDLLQQFQTRLTSFENGLRNRP